ncbi:MAG: FkbM family methyltransferase [Deltaproteobacteria bacterium]|nr:FkbM family methyltransferase [Deltaproteobacteria bacterium]
MFHEQRDLREEVDEYFEAGAVVRPGDVVLDVGANVGAFAMRVAERTAGDVTIHCFEPAPPTFAILERNLRTQPHLARARARAWPLALTRTEHAGRERDFYFFANAPTNSTYDLDDKHAEHEAYFAAQLERAADRLRRASPRLGARLGTSLARNGARLFRRDHRLMTWISDRASGVEVQRCRTDSIERWAASAGVTHVDLLKIDVEGAELDVLEGCGAMWSGIHCVAVETSGRDGRASRIRERLVSNGLTEILRFVPRAALRDGLDNVLFVARRPGLP